jgi:hypothetical protein
VFAWIEASRAAGCSASSGTYVALAFIVARSETTRSIEGASAMPTTPGATPRGEAPRQLVSVAIQVAIVDRRAGASDGDGVRCPSDLRLHELVDASDVECRGRVVPRRQHALPFGLANRRQIVELSIGMRRPIVEQA